MEFKEQASSEVLGEGGADDDWIEFVFAVMLLFFLWLLL